MQAVNYPYPVKKLSVSDDIEIAYMEAGSGKQTLLFIHGLANYAAVWKYQLEHLQKQFRCIAIDLPGNGLSSQGDYAYSPFFYAECIRKFCEGLELNDPILTGHSMGGQISVMLSLRFPALFNRLILIAPAGIEAFNLHEQLLMQNTLSLGEFAYTDEYHLEKTIRDSFEFPGTDTHTIISDLKHLLRSADLRTWRKMCYASVNGMLAEPIHPYLTQIQANVLLIFGEKDRLIPNKLLHPFDTTEKIAIQGAAMIPDCEMHLIEQAGHFVQMESAAEVNSIITRWVGN